MDKKRSVPAALKFALLSYGALGKVGWGLLSFASLFIWLFEVPQAMSEVFDFLGPAQRTMATISSVQGTNASVNDVPVMKAIFTYQIDGKDYTSFSYVTQEATEGASVEVEYKVTKPEIARIVGASRSLMGWGVLFLLVLPVSGMILLLFAYRNAIKVWRLVARGKLTDGKLKKVEPTNMTVNEEPVMRYIFEYQDAQGKTYMCSTTTHQGDDLTDDAKEKIVYLESNPAVALPFDALPGDKKADLYGNADVSYSLRLFDYLPVAFLLVNIALFVTLRVL
jgi:hypothetical protein